MGDEVERQVLNRAREGDRAAFGEFVAPYRAQLHAHAYRILASVQDADDALQDALLGAWRGVGGFEERSSLRAWLYRITMHAALKIARNRPSRQLSLDHTGPTDPLADFGAPLEERIWIEPYPDATLREATVDPATRYVLLESVELAFIAALQQLPATQRAVLILRDVLAFSAAEAADLLDTSVASVNSALQRARATVDRADAPSQQATLRDLGADGQRELVEAFVVAWERSDVQAITELLVADVRLSMPPLLVWFNGRDAIARFMAERMFATPWRIAPISANGQLGFACYQQQSPDGPLRLSAVNVLELRGDRIARLTAFLDPADQARFALPGELVS